MIFVENLFRNIVSSCTAVGSELNADNLPGVSIYNMNMQKIMVDCTHNHQSAKLDSPPKFSPYGTVCGCVHVRVHACIHVCTECAHSTSSGVLDTPNLLAVYLHDKLMVCCVVMASRWRGYQ